VLIDNSWWANLTRGAAAWWRGRVTVKQKLVKSRIAGLFKRIPVASFIRRLVVCA